MEEMEELKYLGGIITDDGDMRKEVVHRAMEEEPDI